MKLLYIIDLNLVYSCGPDYNCFFLGWCEFGHIDKIVLFFVLLMQLYIPNLLPSPQIKQLQIFLF